MKRSAVSVIGVASLVVALGILATPAMATASPDTLPDAASLNPIELLDDVSDAVPGLDGRLSTTLNILVLLTVLSLAVDSDPVHVLYPHRHRAGPAQTGTGDAEPAPESRSSSA